MNGVVFQHVGDDDPRPGRVLAPGPQDAGAEDLVGNALEGEDEEPQFGGDRRGDGPWHQDRRPKQTASAECAGHDDCHPEADDGFENYRRDSEEERRANGAPELCTKIPRRAGDCDPAGGALLKDPVLVVRQTGATTGHERTSGGVQPGVLLEGLEDGGDDRIDNDNGQHNDARGNQHRGRSALGGLLAGLTSLCFPVLLAHGGALRLGRDTRLRFSGHAHSFSASTWSPSVLKLWSLCSGWAGAHPLLSWRGGNH